LNLGISALNYVNAIKNNEFTVEEFIFESLDHIKQVDEKLHAFLRINDSAIKNAKEIDAKLKSNQIILQISGNAGTVLSCERTALNLLSRMSGIATQPNFLESKIRKINSIK